MIPALHALTLVFAGSLTASLLAALRSLRLAERSETLAALNLAWVFALLSATSLVTFVSFSAHADTLSLLRSEVFFSRPFVLFVLGSLYLLPVVTLALEDSADVQTRPSSKEVHSKGRNYGTF